MVPTPHAHLKKKRRLAGLRCELFSEVADVASLLLPFPGAYLAERVFELVGLVAVGHSLDEVSAGEAPLVADAHRGDVARAGDA